MVSLHLRFAAEVSVVMYQLAWPPWVSSIKEAEESPFDAYVSRECYNARLWMHGEPNPIGINLKYLELKMPQPRRTKWSARGGVRRLSQIL